LIQKSSVSTTVETARQRAVDILVTWALCIAVVLIIATVLKWGWNRVFENPSGEIESFSHSSAEAAKRGTLHCRVGVSPNPVSWKGKTIRFREAWVEERFLNSHFLAWFPYAKRVGDYNLCFTLEQGDDVLWGSSAPICVLGESGGASFWISATREKPLLFFTEIDPDLTEEVSASLIERGHWRDPRPKDIHFVLEK
jgi:hypothetical protein